MPASSKSQQRFFGVVKAMQKGDIPKKGRAGKIAKQMSKKDVDKYASTKHKGKPEKVKREQRVRELIKKMVREELDNMNEVRIPFSSSHIKQLKRAFKDMKGTLPDNNPLVQKIVQLLKGQDKKVLQQLANADIKYLSDKAKDILGEEKLTEVSAGVNVFYFYKKAKKDKNKFFKMLSDFRKKHSDTKWMKMLNYALVDFNENPKKYKTIDDKQNKLFKNLQQNKKVYEGTCGYGENGELGEEPAGPHLIKKNKNKIKEIGFLAKQVAKLVVPAVRKVIGAELEMDDVNEAKDTIFDVAKKVMKDKSMQNYKSKKGMVKLDMQTANLLTQVFKKINPKMKKILSDLGEKNPAQLVKTLQAVVK